MNNYLKIIIQFLLYFFSSTYLFAQNDENITLDKKRLLVLPSKGLEDTETITMKVTNIIAGKATELGRFIIIDRTQIESVMSEHALHQTGIIGEKDILSIGKLASAEVGLIVTVNTFGQRGVPPKENENNKKEEEKDESLFSWVVKAVVTNALEGDEEKEKKDLYADNIQTAIMVEVREINMNTGISEKSFQVRASHTGGNLAKSLSITLDKLGTQIALKLKELYKIKTEILEIRGNLATILLGEDMGVEPGNIFEVFSHDMKRTIRDKTIKIPGESKGIVQVKSVSENANISKILREWEQIEPGDNVRELVKQPVGFDLGILTSAIPVNRFQFTAWPRPFPRLKMSLLLNTGMVKDSRDELDFMFELGTNLRSQILSIGKLSLASGIKLPLGIAWRDDDAEKPNTVTSIFISPGIDIESSIMISKKWDLILGINYCLTTFHSGWQYSKKENSSDEDVNSYDAVWNEIIGPEPMIDMNGLHIGLGIRFMGFQDIKPPDYGPNNMNY
jgi:hypothetical protein